MPNRSTRRPGRSPVAAVAVCAAAALVVAAAWAHDLAWVTGASMEPTLSSGDLVLAARRVPARPGDVALFEDEGVLVVHRVVSVLEGGDLITRGDANRVADLQPVAPESVRGRVVAVLPFGR